LTFCFGVAQDYHWWWRSFLTSGFTAFYLFVYCVHYFQAKLNIEDSASTFLYHGYILIIVFLFFLLTGKWSRVALISAKNHKRQSVTAQRGKSTQTPKFVTAVPGDSRTPGHSVQATPHAPVCGGLPISRSAAENVRS